MTDTRKEFEKWWEESGWHGYSDKDAPLESWQACQSLNDKRISNLLAVIEAKNALMSQCIESNLHLADGDICTLKLIKEAIAIKPEDVELVDVGKVREIGGSLFASQYSPNNGVKVGDIVYTIKTKE